MDLFWAITVAAAALGLSVWCTAQIRALRDQIEAMRRTLQRKEASHESEN